MRVVILTTQTPHHVHFVREIAAAVPVALVMVETRSLTPPFDISHPFESERDRYERERWFDGRDVHLGEVADTEMHPSLNDGDAVARLRQVAPDAVVVFGTGKLSDDVIATCPEGIVNLHGGDPEEYRGLDTHLWAVYHRDWNGLVTTLHRLDSAIDAGDIVTRRPIPLEHGLKLHQLRSRNTETCVAITRTALGEFAGHGRFAAVAQARVGRTYSFMPAVLKGLCVARFEAYTDRLP